MRPNNERRGNLPVPHWFFQSKLTDLFLCLKAAPGLALFVVLFLGPMALKATRVSATELFVSHFILQKPRAKSFGFPSERINSFIWKITQNITRLKITWVDVPSQAIASLSL